MIVDQLPDAPAPRPLSKTPPIGFFSEPELRQWFEDSLSSEGLGFEYLIKIDGGGVPIYQNSLIQTLWEVQYVLALSRCHGLNVDLPEYMRRQFNSPSMVINHSGAMEFPREVPEPQVRG